jgi:hypothetical protein
LKEGELPAINDTARPIDLLLSKYLAIGCHRVNDTITVYLVQGPGRYSAAQVPGLWLV